MDVLRSRGMVEGGGTRGGGGGELEMSASFEQPNSSVALMCNGLVAAK